jgi:F0F1-type ATP synthase membrane subunit b/b'
MKQNVLDGVVAIEAKAAELVDDAKKQAEAARKKVAEQLDALARELDQEAEKEIAAHKQAVDAKKEAALATLQEQLDAALESLEGVKGAAVQEQAAEVVKRLEQRGDGH